MGWGFQCLHLWESSEPITTTYQYRLFVIYELSHSDSVTKKALNKQWKDEELDLSQEGYRSHACHQQPPKFHQKSLKVPNSIEEATKYLN